MDAYAALDGTVFQGRLLHVLPGHRPPPGPAEQEGAQVTSSNCATAMRRSRAHASCCRFVS